jgi:Domain of unknown function (DUF4394)
MTTVDYALSDSTLVSFDPAAPSVGTFIPVTGLLAGQTLVGIDFRPANGLLYGLGVNSAANTATLYRISVLTGVATVVGSFGPVVGLDLSTASGFGFDFNPVVDRIRVTTDTGENFRINPNNGTLAGLDPMITPAGSEISGAAYTNNETTNGGVTTLYTLDSFSGQLMIQGLGGNPNGGIQSPVGSVGVPFSILNGFDIPPGVDTLVANAPVISGSGLALLTVGGTVELYSINLVTGAGTLIGSFLNGITPASGLAIPLPTGPFPLPTLQLSAFGPDAGGWSSNDTYPRTLADVNGDGMADIIGFSSVGVFESRATGNPGAQFAAPTFELAAFGTDAGGWSSDNTYPRALADVNGDHMADIVGFSQAGVFESLATPGGHFAAPTFELAAFGTSAGGWSSDTTYPRQLADISGNGSADIVGFAANGVWTSFH